MITRNATKSWTCSNSQLFWRIFRQIDQLERTEQSQRLFTNRDEVTRPWLLAGLGFLLLELLLGATIVVRVP